MERIHLFFHGQELNQEEKAQIKAQLTYHFSRGPSDASLCCCISRERDGLAANLQIHSASGHTFIHRESHSIETLMKYIYQSMDLVFKSWKDNQKEFSKSHPMIKNSCRAASHKTLQCPLQSFSNSSPV